MKTYCLIPPVLFLLIVCQDILGDANVKLDGNKPKEGRVLIRYNGTWTLLMDPYRSNFDQLLNGFVICRQLGYTKVDNAYRIMPFNVNDTRYPFNVYCQGSESNINQCQKFQDNPSDPRVAYVRCGFFTPDEKAVQARIVRSNYSNYGAVELKNVNASWTPICADTVSQAWDKRDVQVICRMLGFKGALGATYIKKPRNSGGSFILKKYHCRGDEKTVGECAYGKKYGYPCPTSGYYAGAFCLQNNSSPSVEYRLTGTDAANRGRIEIKYNGIWGTICPYQEEGATFKQTDDYICRTLGYLEQSVRHGWPLYRTETAVSWNYQITCDNQGRCGNVNVTLKSKHCYFDRSIYCRIGSAVRYSVSSGCAPEIKINSTGLSEKEKELITYYEVKITKGVYNNPALNIANFYVPANMTNFTLGDGKMYEHGQNKPLEFGIKYYTKLRVVHKEKDGRVSLGEFNNWFEPFIKTRECVPFPSLGPVTASRGTVGPSIIPTTSATTAVLSLGPILVISILYTLVASVLL